MVIPMEKLESSRIEHRVAQILIEELKLEDVTAEGFDRELDLVDELGIDSMDLTTVVLVLQDEYKITIEEDDYPKLRNIHQIARYVQDLLAH
jgi:acyl carrier protein